MDVMEECGSGGGGGGGVGEESIRDGGDDVGTKSTLLKGLISTDGCAGAAGCASVISAGLLIVFSGTSLEAASVLNPSSTCMSTSLMLLGNNTTSASGGGSCWIVCSEVMVDWMPESSMGLTESAGLSIGWMHSSLLITTTGSSGVMASALRRLGAAAAASALF